MTKKNTPFTIVSHIPTIFKSDNYAQTKKWLERMLSGEVVDKIAEDDEASSSAVRKRVSTLLKVVHNTVVDYPRVQRYLAQKFPEFKRWDLMADGSLKQLREISAEILFCLNLIEVKGAEREIYSMSYYIANQV